MFDPEWLEVASHKEYPVERVPSSPSYLYTDISVASHKSWHSNSAPARSRR